MTTERIKKFIAWKLAPRWLIYWCAFKAVAHSTSGPYGTDHPSDVDVMTMLKRCEEWS